MIYLYLFGTCFHFIYVFMIIGDKHFTGKNPRVFPDLTFHELYGVIAQRSQLEKDLFSRILYGSFAFRQGERAY